MSLAGNCISCAVIFFNISPVRSGGRQILGGGGEQSWADVGAEASESYPIPPTNKTGTSPVTKTVLYFEVDRPDAMTVLPFWVNKSPEGIRGGSMDP